MTFTLLIAALIKNKFVYNDHDNKIKNAYNTVRIYSNY